MPSPPGADRQLRALLRVALPVAIAAVLVCLAVLNVALVSSWHEADDGVLWQATPGGEVVAAAVAPASAGAVAGIAPGDLLFTIDGAEVRSPGDVVAVLHGSLEGRTLTYRVLRQTTNEDLSVTLRPLPTVDKRLYYPLAFVGLLGILLGASVRLRRPNDPATLHFFWLVVAFGGTFAFRYSGRLDHLDYFFLWAHEAALVALPPLFLHFSLVFPDRTHPWARSRAGRVLVPLLYTPALALLGVRILMLTQVLGPISVAHVERLNLVELVYLSGYLVVGLGLMWRELRRLRSVTARRQLRWIVWGSTIGTLPFVVGYVLPLAVGRSVPGGEYTALLLGCIPLAFASAIVRYRLTDVEVIIKGALVVSAWVLFLAIIYGGIFRLVGALFGTHQEQNNSIALIATLVVAVAAPWLKGVIQGALDRLYYRDRYDYRRALVAFARELNSDLDLDRLSTRLVSRIRDTLVVDRIALLLGEPGAAAGDFHVVSSLGFEQGPPSIEGGSGLGARLAVGQTLVVDDPLPLRRLAGEDAAAWRDLGLYAFVPCVSKDVTIAVIAVGRKARVEPLSSEDMALLGAVASQAATAIENARLYGQLRVKADEIERLRQFSDSVVESLSDGLLVVDLDDRVLRWNRRLEDLLGIERGQAVGREMSRLFDPRFLDGLYAARREALDGSATLFRTPLAPASRSGRPLLANVGIAPLRTPDGTRAGSIVVIEDVTDRANLEEQLRLSEKMAAIGLLAAGVAHEVNTPLTGISSFTQMLLERAEPNDPNTQLLEKIERQTFRAAKIVNSLLSLARPSDGEAGPVDVNVIVTDVLALLEHQFRSARIQVRRELSGTALVVRGVEYKLQQVFLNLFLNARDAMAKGGWLSIATRRDARGVIVEVADTGAGIPSEHIARIYDPFFTTKPEGRGTGLGLSVTYGIVQEHGGSLACDSTPGQGTRFTLVLPIVDAPAASRADVGAPAGVDASTALRS